MMDDICRMITNGAEGEPALVMGGELVPVAVVAALSRRGAVYFWNSDVVSMSRAITATNEAITAYVVTGSEGSSRHSGVIVA